MRIVIDMQGAQTESRFRGIGRYTMGFAHAIVRNRGEHEIFLALSGLFPDSIEPIRAAFDGALPQENIRVWYAPSPVKEIDSHNHIRRELAELMREAFIASLQPDVVHITSLFEGYIDDAVTSIGKFDKTTLISVTLYDLIPLLNPEQYLKPNPGYNNYYRRKIESLKNADLLLAISDYAKQEALVPLAISADRIVSVSTAIEKHFKKLTITPEAASKLLGKFNITKSFVLYTGGADERKNLPRLIQAYASLTPELRKQHQLVFAGRMSFNNIEALKAIAKKSGLLTDELIFTGYITEDELVALYNLCQVYIFPSWHEGFGLPVLEAMACGAPVIAANTSSLPEVVGLDDALFDPSSIESIKQKLELALTGEVFRAKLCEHAKQQVKKFSWDITATEAVQAWERVHFKSIQSNSLSLLNSKVKLAFVSPLPPERTGIADYSAELLPALAEYYDIEVVVDQPHLYTPLVNQHYKIRDVDWLRKNFEKIDRVIYQMGNSPFHQYMLPLMQEIPGTVVLHDFFLSGLLAWMELHAGQDGAWTNVLYDAHGYGAVQERYSNLESAKRHYPVNLQVLQNAQGLIFHSNYCSQLLRQWNGDAARIEQSIIPLLRSPADIENKLTAKNNLGLGDDDLLVCSFGFLDQTKLNDRLLSCWFESKLATDKRCHLVFVGNNNGGVYGDNLLNLIKNKVCSSRITITGFVEPEQYRQYLTAADIAVQLRTCARGETSAATLDCMNYGLPLIANANGSMAELDSEAVWLLPDEFDDSTLIHALETLWLNSERRCALGALARRIILERHSPINCAKSYTEAIERFHYISQTKTPQLINAVAKYTDQCSNTELLHLSKLIATNLPHEKPLKSFYLDITATYSNDLKTGIERVARALLIALLKSPPAGYRIEPVYLDCINGEWHHRHAHVYTLEILGCPSRVLSDEICEPVNGDIFLGLDYCGDKLVQAKKAGLFNSYKNNGVSVYAIIFDLLPILMPNVFPAGADKVHLQWLKAISEFDGAVCISKAVADELIAWHDECQISSCERRSYQFDWFHLGADVSNSAPSVGLPDNAEAIIAQLEIRPSFLMVGTIEPRKGYFQVIEAFTELWDNGYDINLVVVGHEGWKTLSDEVCRDIPETVQKLKNHPELNNRLFWLEGISDEFLEKLYAGSTCLISASYGEGFGLPLIEAAQHKLPIFARDIPVFREVAGEHAEYFTAKTSEQLASAISDWLAKYKNGTAALSENMRWLTWQQSAQQLLSKILPST